MEEYIFASNPHISTIILSGNGVGSQVRFLFVFFSRDIHARKNVMMILCGTFKLKQESSYQNENTNPKFSDNHFLNKKVWGYSLQLDFTASRNKP